MTKNSYEIQKIQNIIFKIEKQLKHFTIEDWEFIYNNKNDFSWLIRYDNWRISILSNFAPFPRNGSLANTMYTNDFDKVLTTINDFLLSTKE